MVSWIQTIVSGLKKKKKRSACFSPNTKEHVDTEIIKMAAAGYQKNKLQVEHGKWKELKVQKNR